ncbi:hypothetical protein WDW86_22040 [Bdellovibrionota bacterium FG-2]
MPSRNELFTIAATPAVLAVSTGQLSHILHAALGVLGHRNHDRDSLKPSWGYQ